MDVFPSSLGRIEVIAGCMFAGKSEELARRLRRSIYASQKVVLATRDNRHDGKFRTHSGVEMDCHYIKEAGDLLRLPLEGVHVVGIDEGQFLGDQLPEVCSALAARNTRVIVAGLDMDFMAKPFENMAMLMGAAEYVTKLSAICVDCGEPATRSYRLVESEERHLEGAEGVYVPLCRRDYLRRSKSL